MNSTIKKNLEMLAGSEKGQLQKHLCTESLGGNAGTADGKPCFGANFLFCPETGKIEAFTNYGFRYPNAEQYEYATFRIGFDLRDTGKMKIVNLYFNKEPKRKAKETLKESARLHNEMYGY